MADKKGIVKLDEKLVSMRLIPRQMLADLPLVHRKMNSILKKTGAVLSDEVFETGNAALRKWLQLLSKQGASQEKLTAYLRCGLAHLTYDYTESQYHQIGVDDLVSRSILSLKLRKLHTSFFKPAAEPKPVPAKKSSAGKITPIKKSELKKPKAKTSAKAKPKAKAATKPKAKAAAKPKAKTSAKAKPKAAVKPKAKAATKPKAKAATKPKAKAATKPKAKAAAKTKAKTSAKAKPKSALKLPWGKTAAKKPKAKTKAKPATKSRATAKKAAKKR